MTRKLDLENSGKGKDATRRMEPTTDRYSLHGAIDVDNSDKSVDAYFLTIESNAGIKVDPSWCNPRGWDPAGQYLSKRLSQFEQTQRAIDPLLIEVAYTAHFPLTFVMGVGQGMEMLVDRNAPNGTAEGHYVGEFKLGAETDLPQRFIANDQKTVVEHGYDAVTRFFSAHFSRENGLEYGNRLYAVLADEVSFKKTASLDGEERRALECILRNTNQTVEEVFRREVMGGVLTVKGNLYLLAKQSKREGIIRSMLPKESPEQSKSQQEWTTPGLEYERDWGE